MNNKCTIEKNQITNRNSLSKSKRKMIILDDYISPSDKINLQLLFENILLQPNPNIEAMIMEKAAY